MGRAIETIVSHAANPGAAGANTTAAAGDTLTVRSFPASASALLEQIIRGGTAPGFAQIKSPMLHDDVQGVRVFSGADPSTFLLPREVGQPLVSQDTLTVSVSGGTAETDLVAHSIYYSDLSGQQARLYGWGDVSGLIKAIKPLTVAVNTNATAGEWTDTLITATEDLLHANHDYAVLGFLCETPLSVVGIKGQETGNLRIGVAGSSDSASTADVFVRLSDMHGTPHIPVFNAANKGSFSVCTAHHTASVSATVQLVLAELSQTLS